MAVEGVLTKVVIALVIVAAVGTFTLIGVAVYRNNHSETTDSTSKTTKASTDNENGGSTIKNETSNASESSSATKSSSETGITSNDTSSSEASSTNSSSETTKSSSETGLTSNDSSSSKASSTNSSNETTKSSSETGLTSNDSSSSEASSTNSSNETGMTPKTTSSAEGSSTNSTNEASNNASASSVTSFGSSSTNSSNEATESTSETGSMTNATSSSVSSSINTSNGATNSTTSSQGGSTNTSIGTTKAPSESGTTSNATTPSSSSSTDASSNATQSTSGIGMITNTTSSSMSSSTNTSYETTSSTSETGMISNSTSSSMSSSTNATHGTTQATSEAGMTSNETMETEAPSYGTTISGTSMNSSPKTDNFTTTNDMTTNMTETFSSVELSTTTSIIATNSTFGSTMTTSGGTTKIPTSTTMSPSSGTPETAPEITTMSTTSTEIITHSNHSSSTTTTMGTTTPASITTATTTATATTTSTTTTSTTTTELFTGPWPCEKSSSFFGEYPQNGFCDPTMNNSTCLYDGGDCCLPQIESSLCPPSPSKACHCHKDDTLHPKYEHPTCKIDGASVHLFDEVCDEEFNNPECDWDNGACCLPAVAASKCMAPMYGNDTELGLYMSQNAYTPLRQEECLATGGTNLFLIDNYVTGCVGAQNKHQCNFHGNKCCSPMLIDMECYKDDCKCHLTDTIMPTLRANGCPNYGFISKWGTGYNSKCDKQLNISRCGFDGGACMRVVYNETDPCNNLTLGNGACDQVNNNQKCGWDGGDCCMPLINDDNCFGQGCWCNRTNFKHRTMHRNGCYTNDTTKLGDGKCHDELNTPQCLHDLGDCCLLIIDDSECTDCMCMSEKIRHWNTEDKLLLALSSMSTNVHNNDFWPISAFWGIRLTLTYKETLNVENGLCDGPWNNKNRLYDNGECCKPMVSDQKCVKDVDCTCYLDNTQHPIYEESDCYYPFNFLGDGFCDDEANTEECMYDFGDCCTSTVFDKNCVDCFCVATDSQHTLASQNGCSKDIQNQLKDFICQDETNIEACNYDQGDCCRANIRYPGTNVCKNCTCHENNKVATFNKDYWSAIVSKSRTEQIYGISQPTTTVMTTTVKPVYKK